MVERDIHENSYLHKDYCMLLYGVTGSYYMNVFRVHSFLCLVLHIHAYM